jgi:hypothetical protein
MDFLTAFSKAMGKIKSQKELDEESDRHIYQMFRDQLPRDPEDSMRMVARYRFPCPFCDTEHYCHHRKYSIALDTPRGTFVGLDREAMEREETL